MTSRVVGSGAWLGIFPSGESFDTNLGDLADALYLVTERPAQYRLSARIVEHHKLGNCPKPRPGARRNRQRQADCGQAVPIGIERCFTAVPQTSHRLSMITKARALKKQPNAVSQLSNSDQV